MIANLILKSYKANNRLGEGVITDRVVRGSKGEGLSEEVSLKLER